MATTYEECTQDVLDLADKIMRKHYQDLLSANVEIKYLFHINADGVPLKHKGWPAAATVQVNNLKKRRAGAAQVVITIDQNWWTQHDKNQNAAVIDHELYHVMIAEDDDGKLIEDDDGCPKVKLRPHDFEAGGFHDIVQRHGGAAPECATVVDCSRKWAQLNLFAGDDMRPGVGESGIETVTISTADGKSVTMTGEQFEKLPDAIDKAAKKKRRKSGDPLKDAVEDAFDEAGLVEGVDYQKDVVV